MEGMMGYRKHATSKHSRIMHKRRLDKRKRKYGGLAAFAYDSANGCRSGKTPGKLK